MRHKDMRRGATVPDGMLESILGILNRPMGANRPEIDIASGYATHNVKRYVVRMVDDQLLFMAGAMSNARYFATKNAAVRGRMLIVEDIKARAIARRKRKHKETYVKRGRAKRSHAIESFNVTVPRNKKPPAPSFRDSVAGNLAAFPITYLPGIERMYQPAPIERPVFSAMRPGQYL